jgi:hypothetical protein
VCVTTRTGGGNGFKLVRPCDNCPFRTDGEPYIRAERAVEIAQSLERGAMFPCHKTTVDVETDDGDERVTTPDSQFCAGALIAMERSGTSNQMVRIGERLGLFDAERLDMDSPVGDLRDFVERHAERVDDEPEPCGIADEGCLAPAGWMEGGAIVTNYDMEPTEPCPACGTMVCEACTCDCEVEDFG